MQSVNVPPRCLLLAMDDEPARVLTSIAILIPRSRVAAILIRVGKRDNYKELERERGLYYDRVLPGTLL